MADFDFAYHKFCPVEVNGSPRVRNLALPPIVFSRDAPMGAFLLSLLFLSLANSVFLPFSLLSPPRQSSFPI